MNGWFTSNPNPNPDNLIFRQLMKVTNERHVCRDDFERQCRLVGGDSSLVSVVRVNWRSLVEYTNYKFGNEAT
jgi:hypothetical protein